MRFLWVVALPLLVQIAAYVIVFIAATGGGSFMGLLAMPVSVLALLALLTHGYVACRMAQAWPGMATARAWAGHRHRPANPAADRARTGELSEPLAAIGG